MARLGKPAAASDAWIVFEDESGCVLRPPHAKTWARRGQAPVVTVRGRGSGRVNIAGLTCCRHGHRSRLFFRLLVYHGRSNEENPTESIWSLIKRGHWQTWSRPAWTR